MLAYFVIIPILIAVFLYLFSSSTSSRIVAIIAQTIYMGFTVYLFMQSRAGDIITVVGGYRVVLGVTLKADMLSTSFIMLTALLFLVAAIYGLKESSSKLYWLLMFIWEGLIVGIFLSRDLFNVFVLLEVATLIVAVLIMFVWEKRSMFDGLIFLMINTVAVQFYLLGVGYIYMLAGTLDMVVAAEAISQLDPSQLILPYALIMTPLVFKCALIPLASWLPKVQGIPRAPSAVSALLSGLHVKCSLFLFIRISNMFSTIDTSGFFLVLGIITAVLSIIMAFSQKDIKLILAYSSTAQIGLIMAGLNINTTYATVGSFYHIINHAIFKTALFLSVGIIVGLYKTRDIDKIRGLLKRSPLLSATTLLAILGIVGAPLFNGSISKYFIMADASPWLYGILIVVNLGTITLYIKYMSIFFGTDTSDALIKVDVNKHISVAILSVMCLIMGVFGQGIIGILFGIEATISTSGYIEKIMIFAASCGIGFLICRYINKENNVLAKIRGLDVNFRGMCWSIGLFFIVMLLFTEFMV